VTTHRELVVLVQDVQGLLLLLDHMAVAGPELQKKILHAVRVRLNARCNEILHPNKGKRKVPHPTFIDNTPDATSTAGEP
jgi:hypothetical protein